MHKDILVELAQKLDIPQLAFFRIRQTFQQRRVGVNDLFVRNRIADEPGQQGEILFDSFPVFSIQQFIQFVVVHPHYHFCDDLSGGD
ncbi:hypothetical protein D3C75_916330 [compost metagenome]